MKICKHHFKYYEVGKHLHVLFSTAFLQKKCAFSLSVYNCLLSVEFKQEQFPLPAIHQKASFIWPFRNKVELKESHVAVDGENEATTIEYKEMLCGTEILVHYQNKD